MRNTVKAFLLAAGVLLSLTGCQKGSFGKVGQEIRFGAVTGQPETRTSYSNSNEGETPETTGWERIDWKQGDIFRVYSSVAAKLNGNHYSDYYVNGRTSNGKISEASIENNEAGGLVWGEGTNDFYALYPYNGFTVTDKDGKITAAKAAIPATQLLTKDEEDGEYYPDMKYAFMLASAKAEPKSSVELDFYPYFTAFEFEIYSDDDIKIKRFKMTSTDKVAGYSATPLSGEFTAIPDNNTWKVENATISDENRSVTATFESPIELTLAGGNGKNKTNTAHFTVFAAPRTLKSITVEFTVEVDGETKTRSLFLSYAEGNKQGKTAGTPIEFAARKKHYFKGFFIRDNYDADGLRFYLEPMWEKEDLGSTSNANNVQCTQFVVGPANVVQNAWDDRLKAPTETAAQEQGLTGDEYDKFVDPIKNASRQTWEFLTDGKATIDYSIMLPKAGTWRVEICGDTNAFTVTPTSGKLSAATTGSTIINIEITPNKTSAGTIWLKTFAKMEDGTEYSLDSETQLYDLRGYHKFVYNPSHTYTSKYTE